MPEGDPPIFVVSCIAMKREWFMCRFPVLVVLLRFRNTLGLTPLGGHPSGGPTWMGTSRPTFSRPANDRKRAEELGDTLKP